jgi:hypothetical protein
MNANCHRSTESTGSLLGVYSMITSQNLMSYVPKYVTTSKLLVEVPVWHLVILINQMVGDDMTVEESVLVFLTNAIFGALVRTGWI